MIPLFKAEFYDEGEYIYNEGEHIENIYFLHSGQANFVLPLANFYPYIKIEEGDHFGIIDIIGY